FGHEKGAFTGAYCRKIGLFEKAKGGSILLDEIGDMGLSLQVKLLRVLQEKCFERVGGVKPLEANVRVIAASNKDLETAVEQQQFREDLYFRLSVVPIHLPPLKEHKADIKLLFGHFLKKLNKQLMKDIKGISDAAMHKLMQHYWPGNVRELENVLERAIIFAKEQIIAEDDISFKFGKGLTEKKGLTARGQENQSFDPKPIVEKLIKDRDKANAAFIEKYDQESFNFLKDHSIGPRWKDLWEKYKPLRNFKIEDNRDYSTEQKVAIAEEMKKALINRGETVENRRTVVMAMGMTENTLKGMVHQLKRKNKDSSA
ncbi:sigma-54-dependent Fis family transcriptional regulator, partial [bacterium]|nr:sigma-54-dependent Fis family transcriptional regulator [bacterium]